MNGHFERIKSLHLEGFFVVIACNSPVYSGRTIVCYLRLKFTSTVTPIFVLTNQDTYSKNVSGS